MTTAAVIALAGLAIALWPARHAGAWLADSQVRGVRRLAHWVRSTWRRDWSRPVGREPERAAAEFADALALALRSGLPAPDAWSLAARSVPSGQPRLGASDLLSRAWQLSHESGAPLVPAITTAATSLRAYVATQARRRSLLAGPRASMTVLTALPLVGPLLGPLLGLDVFGGNGIGAFTVPAGLFLTGLGWWWAATILRRAARPEHLLTGPAIQ